MKWSILFVLLTVQAQAEVCQRFKALGRFENISDKSRGQVEFNNEADCENLTLIDNDDNIWLIDLSGKPTPLPDKFLKNEGVHISDAFYTSKLNNNDQIELNFEGNTELSGPAGIKIGARISYIGLATYTASSAQEPAQIRLDTQSFKLLSVNAPHIDQSENSGFIKGANFILDMIKNLMDVTLKAL